MTDAGSRERIESVRKPRECPICGAKVAKILWGMPAFDERLQRKLQEGEITLGGCMVSDDDPTWECIGCGRRIHKKPS